MKFLLKTWSVIAGGTVLIWGLLRFYDEAFANGDGILASVDLDVLLSYSIALVALLAVATLGTRARYHWLANLSASLCGLLFFWILAEVLCFGLINLGISDAPRPFHSRLKLNDDWVSYKEQFWGDISPKFGRWRLPNSSIRIPICNGDTVLLTSNAYGMRDTERQLANPGTKKRAVLLGDSFMEGYLVDTPQRYSNLLEAETGREHLNFGINGTSPINYFLTYKHLASQFEHDVVIVSLLSANDFEDVTDKSMNEGLGRLSLLRYPIYRPYWRGSQPEVTLDYTLSDVSQSVAAPLNQQQPVRVKKTVDSVYHTLPLGKKILAEVYLNSYAYALVMNLLGKSASRNARPVNSYATESFESRWFAFGHSLELLLEASKGKKVFLIGMPILPDVSTYAQNHQDDLSPRIEALCDRYGATYINLLPVVEKMGPKAWSTFYVPCDGHFNAKGERLVAETLLGSPAYREAMGLDD